MERLRQKDAEAGIVHESLTDEQKAEIAEVRRVAEARHAELKILHQSALAAVFDPAEREQHRDRPSRDLQRVGG